MNGLPPRRTGFDSRRVIACGNDVGRRSWSTGFLGDLPFPPPLYFGAAPYTPHFTLISSQDFDLRVAQTSPITHPIRLNNSPCVRDREAQGDKGDTDTRTKYSDAVTRRDLNWRSVFSYVCPMDLTLLTTHLPRKQTVLNFHWGLSRIFACGNRAGRCRWSAGFLGISSFPRLFIPALLRTHLTYPTSALKTSCLCSGVVCEHLQSFIDFTYGHNDGLFQQDNAPCHMPKLSSTGSRNILKSSNDYCGHLVRPIRIFQPASRTIRCADARSLIFSPRWSLLSPLVSLLYSRLSLKLQPPIPSRLGGPTLFYISRPDRLESSPHPEQLGLFVLSAGRWACLYCRQAVGLVCTVGRQLGLFVLSAGSWACLYCRQAVGLVCTVGRQLGLFVRSAGRWACLYCRQAVGLVCTVGRQLGLFVLSAGSWACLYCRQAAGLVWTVGRQLGLFALSAGSWACLHCRQAVGLNVSSTARSLDTVQVARG
ncbi:hypothetical protein PR048_022725 [Dryococelus australis]|uniref:Uncharacterized protein n=1 Tax=Dryococelus australis TaxID=614101 RepID=A0ABQ9GS50_9NEOP|nr:hypothetical protein PR048_022725 [Dryococelus australis]